MERASEGDETMLNLTGTEKPKFSASKVMNNGKPAIKFVITLSGLVPELHDAIIAAGYQMDPTLANTRYIYASTPEEINNARPQILLDYFRNNA